MSALTTVNQPKITILIKSDQGSNLKFRLEVINTADIHAEQCKHKQCVYH